MNENEKKRPSSTYRRFDNKKTTKEVENSSLKQLMKKKGRDNKFNVLYLHIAQPGCKIDHQEGLLGSKTLSLSSSHQKSKENVFFHFFLCKLMMMRPGSARLTSRGLAGLAEHYGRVPGTYHTAWFYGKDTPYEGWQRSLLKDALQCDNAEGQVGLVDIGGGTGRFAALMHDALELGYPALCVDPSEGMLEEAKALYGSKVETLCTDAVEFAKTCQPASFQRCLLKEVVHHIPNDQLDTMFQGLHDGLVPGGVCAILTRPHKDIDYPFMQRAYQVWQENQPDEQIFVKSLERSGFGQVSSATHAFPVDISQALWIDMIKDRFWSTFSESNFNDEQLASGIEEIRSKFPPDSDGNIQFEERVAIITARK